MLLIMFSVNVLRFRSLYCSFLGLVVAELDARSSEVSAGASLEASIEAT
jgi:hypothetical protein